MANDSMWDGTLSPEDFQVASMNLIEKWAMCESTFQPWRWEPCPKLPWGVSHSENGYLSLGDILINYLNSHNVAEGEYELEQGEETLDPATLVNSHHCESHLYTFHIVYNHSYKVPMLLFHGHSIDGRPLELEEIKKDLPSHSCQLLEDSKWTFLTQEEHPYLNRPWYALHPCGTSKWMGFLFSSRTSSNVKPTTIVEQDLTQSESCLLKEDNGQNSPTMEEIISGGNNFSKSNIESTTCNTSRTEIISQYLIAWLSVVGQVVGLRVPFEIVKLPS
ncbi:hypothetical protein SUGI_0182180 [Cryptomeria japonica]|uniref:ubiquitin-like-conjugating enzyme ATG10 isoform X2 n=1 Tax=Cryptomeria japonica TaxID=3369 RepID=UPI002408EABA|nr:ubiquitin-like-conjugating enzyme ATG10 isoform X2 [Cryptomeria japonica]GLJ12021.1 hypothetical protein SUGI_0182180 [Cryptomeria japonica]